MIGYDFNECIECPQRFDCPVANVIGLKDRRNRPYEVTVSFGLLCNSDVARTLKCWSGVMSGSYENPSISFRRDFRKKLNKLLKETSDNDGV